MKIKITIILLLAIVVSAFTINKQEKIVKAEEFQKEADTIGLKFVMPENYKETVVKKNRDLWYSFAIKNKDADFEIRYTIRSLKPQFEEYEKCKLDKNCLMINPNNIYKGTTMTNVLNMTAGQGAEIGPFPAEAVKNEFNADAGGSAFFEFNCEFRKGYKYGQMVYLHKDNVADVIITYLSNDVDVHSDLMMEPFHALTFK
ncbi:hypothetical protein [Flavobacterium alkalisoli]|uniref:hypothetical protein n=1 Tax=Flavobacterium alkalisoli TaxID=2602769 RepID=UPI003A91C8F3